MKNLYCVYEIYGEDMTVTFRDGFTLEQTLYLLRIIEEKRILLNLLCI